MPHKAAQERFLPFRFSVAFPQRARNALSQFCPPAGPTCRPASAVAARAEACGGHATASAARISGEGDEEE